MNVRQVVLDTETTGLEVQQGHRIVEIGAIEMINRRVTSRRLHYLLNPDRDIDAGASDVHGHTLEKLRDQPRFAEIAAELLSFLDGAEVLIHNAPFDVSFLDAELARARRDGHGLAHDRLAGVCRVTDTLALAREIHPGQKNSLDALCKRYNVDNSRRALHGALLDAELLCEVYLAMTGGQAALFNDTVERDARPTAQSRRAGPRPARLRVIEPTPEESAAHEKRLAEIDRKSQGRCVWRTTST